MNAYVEVRHQAAISGRITDDATKKALAGARIAIIQGPSAFEALLAGAWKAVGARWSAIEERLDRTRSGGDGHYHFLDLPSGAYVLAVSLPQFGARYGTAEVACTVEDLGDGGIRMAIADAAVPPTALSGHVLRQNGENDDPIVMATVRIKGSGESTFSGSGGAYLISPLEPGTQTVVASTQGEDPKTRSVELERGMTKEEIFTF